MHINNLYHIDIEKKTKRNKQTNKQKERNKQTGRKKERKKERK